ncbi:MAG: ABC transporter substrate-binding protein [Ruminiclostridium sp.]|nr:ABC transporter substrate-binding protein [Ruminiclostridium sp.]
MKRVAAAAIAAITPIVLLSGCDKSEEYGKDVMRLRWVTYGMSVPADVKKIVKAANDYSAEKIGVVVDLEIQQSEVINLIMASWEYYDMVYTCEWLNPFNTNAAKGLYYDITDLIETETPDLYRIIGDYWEAGELNGRIYGVPTLKDMGAEMMFRFNADYYEGEKGMVIPEFMRFEDLEPYLEVYKKDFPAKYPMAMSKGGIAGFFFSLESVVGSLIVIPYNRETPEIIPIWEDEEIMDRLRLLHKWYTLGYINPDASALELSALPDDMPVRFGVAWRGYSGYSNPADWGFNVKTSIYDGPYISKNTEQGAMTAICAGCDEEHAKAALRYIELLNTDRKFRDIFAYGIEGEHYRYLNNGTVLRTQDGIDRYHVSLYPFGSVVNASVESVSEDYLSDPDQWAKVFDGYEKYGIYSGSEGFVYDRTRKEDIVTTVTAIWSNYSTDLSTGTSDPDVIMPKMKAEMESAGLNELLDDIRSQFAGHLESIS